MKKIIAYILAPFLVLTACQEEEERANAYGNFETVETIVSVEANGKLLFLNVEEGKRLEKGAMIAIVDTTALHLQKLQVMAQAGSVSKKVRSAQPQIEVLEEQKRNLERERKRIESLLAAKAATPKQLDDLKGQIDVVNRQIASAKEDVAIANRAILSGKSPLEAQVRVLDEQIKKCYVRNPVSGTVLSKLAESSEVVGFGAPLYKVANLDHLILRAYISGPQLSEISLGQNVNVRIDGPEDTHKNLDGEVAWIASEAEFTPKTIQTEAERVNLVYAMKVRVKNNGELKIGMPGEVWLNAGTKETGED